ncbi:MAG: beta-hydroxyacyl-ACP dehydratase [Planctomycetota bacterium]
MRWIWLDRILTLDPGKSLVALKNISAAEDVIHDAVPAVPHMPHTLIIEGMAQAAGILVGHTGHFREKVILAKITRAQFEPLIPGPGTTLRHTATLDRFDPSGAATTGTVDLLDPATGSAQPFARIQLMFSHIDQNRAGLEFPDHNFVFTDQFMGLLERSGIPAPS